MVIEPQKYLDIHRRVLHLAREIAIAKSKDYNREHSGNVVENFDEAVREGFAESTLHSVGCRWLDKKVRFANVIKMPHQPAVASESLLDTLVDLINYSIIMYVVRGEEFPEVFNPLPEAPQTSEAPTGTAFPHSPEITGLVNAFINDLQALGHTLLRLEILKCKDTSSH